MMNYAEYDFYLNQYKGSLSIDLFNSLIVKASREIDRVINCDLDEEKINSLSERDQFKLKYTACELVDYFNVNGSNSSEGQASSISIDSVSINKATKSENALITSKNNIINNLPHSLIRFL